MDDFHIWVNIISFFQQHFFREVNKQTGVTIFRWTKHNSLSCALPLTLGDAKEDVRKKNNKKWKQRFCRDLIISVLMEQSRRLKISYRSQPLIPAKF